MPFLLAAVDPDAEQRLVGLAGSVVDGRPLRAGDAVSEKVLGTARNRSVPVLATSRPYLDGGLRATLTRLPAARPAGTPAIELEETLRRAAGTPAGVARTELADAYRTQLAAGISDQGECCFGQLQIITQPGAVTYDERPGGELRAAAVSPAAPEVFGNERDFSCCPVPGSPRTLGRVPSAGFRCPAAGASPRSGGGGQSASSTRRS